MKLFNRKKSTLGPVIVCDDEAIKEKFTNDISKGENKMSAEDKGVLLILAGLFGSIVLTVGGAVLGSVYSDKKKYEAFARAAEAGADVSALADILGGVPKEPKSKNPVIEIRLGRKGN